MLNFFANIFGYVLNFIYEAIKNYGLAIILFSILLKLILLPLTIKQQRTLKKSQKVQAELKVIQEKYKNDKEKLNKEMMDLYKRENMSPFSGCLSSIIQLILLLAMFYLVRNPLTYMKKVDIDEINIYKEKIVAELGEENLNKAYPEISIVKYINNKIDNVEENTNKEDKLDDQTEKEIENEESEEIKEELAEEENEELEIDKDLYINMNFLGLDLGKIPQENFNDIKVFIIPVLYIISSFISIRLMPTATPKTENDKKEDTKNNEESKKDEKTEQEEASEQMNKTMTWMMPILAVSVSLMAPLGLALYWLVNNILMILERIFIDKNMNSKGEEENG